ncbi:MAG: hypothetical protein B7Y95_07180 [Rhizobiales bacterium 32-66-11]|nr:MAG: hypothetical protein B7Y95_07180 [Rhizobiales bacterium 32-66-11]
MRAQDAWRFAPDFKLTLGGRLENGPATQGFNLATTAKSAGPSPAPPSTLFHPFPRRTFIADAQIAFRGHRTRAHFAFGPALFSASRRLIAGASGFAAAS